MNNIIQIKKASRSSQVALKTIYAAFKILKNAGEEMRGRDVIEKIIWVGLDWIILPTFAGMKLELYE